MLTNEFGGLIKPRTLSDYYYAILKAADLPHSPFMPCITPSRQGHSSKALMPKPYPLCLGTTRWRSRSTPTRTCSTTKSARKWHEWKHYLIFNRWSLNFSTAAGCAHPLITQVKDPSDLKRWHNGPRDHLHLISTATGSLLWSLIECLSDRENHSQCGRRSSPLHTVPITLCSSALCSPYAFDFDLTKNSKSIGPDDFDLIREAMCKFLQDQHLQTAKMLFDRRMSSPTSYRMIPRVMWFESLEQAFIDCIFGDHPAYNEACTLLANTTSAQLEQATLREESLARALELIAHPACFAKHLIPCPKTWEDALGALCNDAYAFHKRFQKGKHRGCQALAFTSDSLKRLLHTVSCNESLFDSFLERAAAQDLLLDRSEVLNIGGETRRVILFRLNDESLSLAEK